MDAEYWVEYWKNKGRVLREAMDKEMAELKAKTEKRTGAITIKQLKKRYALDVKPAPCIKSGEWCDKKDACDVLGQCIVTISRFRDRPEIIEELRGPKTSKEIIRVLAKHDPEPMKSYYPLYKTKNEKANQKGSNP